MFFDHFHDSTVPGAGLPRPIPIQHDFVERPILTMFSWRFLGVQPVPARKPGTNVLDNASLAARVPSVAPVSQMAQKCCDESIVRQHVFLTRSSPGTRLQKIVSINVARLRGQLWNNYRRCIASTNSKHDFLYLGMQSSLQ